MYFSLTEKDFQLKLLDTRLEDFPVTDFFLLSVLACNRTAAVLFFYLSVSSVEGFDPNIPFVVRKKATLFGEVFDSTPVILQHTDPAVSEAELEQLVRQLLVAHEQASTQIEAYMLQAGIKILSPSIYPATHDK